MIVTYLLIGLGFSITSFIINRKMMQELLRISGPYTFLAFSVTVTIAEILFWPLEIFDFFWQEFGEDIKYIFNGRKRK